MGEGFTVVCTKCGKEQSFYLGVGKLSCHPEYMIEKIPAARREQIRSLLAQSPPPETEHGDRLYACPQCDTLTTRFYVRVARGSKAIYETSFKCAKCQSPLVDGSKDVGRYRCRFCGERALEMSGISNWD